MSIKSQGGVFGRNPTFATLTVENGISVGSLTVGGEAITGLSYEGAWNANTNTPDITASPAQGQFWIVSVAGSTDVGGITNWTDGDWALYDGSNWQRVEGGNTDLSSGVTGQLAVTNGGTGASDAATARTNLGLAIGTNVQAYDATILKSADIGSTVQGYDADTAKYDDTTANFTGTLQNGGSNVVVDSDIGSTVQAYDANILTSSDIGSTVQGYDADTAKLDTSQIFTVGQTFYGQQTFTDGTGASTGGIIQLKNRDTTISGADEVFGQIEWYSSDSSGGNTGVFAKIDAVSNRVFDGDNASGMTMRFFTGRKGTGLAEQMSLEQSFSGGADLKVHNGNVIIGTSGNGIDFSATSGTGTSELLDDYEEGTFTVGAGNLTYTGTFSGSGYYTKIGNVVTVNGTLSATTLSGGAGTFFGALPFTPSSIATGTLELRNRASGCFVQAYTNGYVYVTGFSGYPEVQFTITYKV